MWSHILDYLARQSLHYVRCYFYKDALGFKEGGEATVQGIHILQVWQTERVSNETVWYQENSNDPVLIRRFSSRHKLCWWNWPCYRERDNWEPLTQPCFLHPNLTVIAQLSLELCQAGCQQGSCSAEQTMWTVTTQSPASGKGCKHIKDFRSLILPTTSPIIKLSFHPKLTLESSDSVSAIPTFEYLVFQQQNQLFPDPTFEHRGIF